MSYVSKGHRKGIILCTEEVVGRSTGDDLPFEDAHKALGLPDDVEVYGVDDGFRLALTPQFDVWAIKVRSRTNEWLPEVPEGGKIPIVTMQYDKVTDYRELQPYD